MVHTGTVYKAAKRLKLFDAPFGGNVLGFVDGDNYIIATDRRKRQRRVRVVYPQPGYVNISLGHLQRSRKPISELLKYTAKGVVMRHAEEDFDGHSTSSSAAGAPAKPPPKPASAQPDGELPPLTRKFSDVLTDSASDSDDEWLEADPSPRPPPKKPAPETCKPRGVPTPPRVPYQEMMRSFHEFLAEASVEILAEIAAEAYEEVEEDLMIEEIMARPAAKPKAAALTLFRVRLRAGPHKGQCGTVHKTEAGGLISVKLDGGRTVEAPVAQLRYLDSAENYAELTGL